MTTKVQSLDRTFDILELISREGKRLSLTEISNGVNLPRSTTYRLLASLQSRGYIEKDPSSSLYRLGLQFISLSSSLLNNLELKTESEVFLKRLSQQTASTVFLAIRQDLEMVFYDRVETYGDIRKYCIVGQRQPLYCTALGKSLLSGLKEDEIRDMFEGYTFKPYTANTISSLKSLLLEIGNVKEKGWALDDEEHQVGITCVSAPIFDYRNTVIAAVSTSWEKDSKTKKEFERTIQLVVATAVEISRRMGKPDLS